MNTERAYVYKYGEDLGKKKYLENRINSSKRSSKRCVEYWINKGLTNEESKIKVSDHQKKYSKEILIQKYGEKRGIEILKDRNDRWQNSLKNRDDYNFIQSKKDVRSVEFYIKKYDNKYIKHYCNDFLKELFNDKLNDLIEILYENNYLDFLTLIKDNFQYNNYLLTRITKIKILSYVFKKNQKEIKNDLLKLYSLKNKNGYGTTFIVDGIIFRSLGEVTIYKHLKNMLFDFEYDYIYPNQKNTSYKCDFYLKKYDLYIEYAGMQNVKRTKKNQEILENYDSRLMIKILNIILVNQLMIL
jgi:hypothetical protein